MFGKTLDEEAIFKIAAGIPSAETRAEYLQQACCGDDALRDRLETLLRAHESAPHFLESPPLGIDATVVPTSEQRGSQIGPYLLREQLGEGGMGIVYVAEQTEPVRRKVALKIIKPGMDTRNVIARFEAERQALAMMSHPNIAKVLDGGSTENGRPFFVMELVKGLPITQFCNDRKLSIRERLELFVTVCQAVQHAHLKGIIHRDLKPSNVLVELHDITAVPKVIDFGIAKATNQQLTQQTIYTQYAQLIGTPLYMSPEQAELSGLDIDTRSDVYSLGVMLYELLTGVTPFDESTLSSVGLDEMRRIIREDEPPRPSHKVNTLANEQISTISETRRTDPRELSVSMQRELDWIVMRALEKDRTRRYESASALAADIQRYLDDETVEACPPSVTYRLRKYAKRHKALLTTVSLMAVTLLIATGFSLWSAVQADQAREEADLEKEHAVTAQAKSEENFSAALDAIDKLLQHASSPELAEIPQAQSIRRKILEDVLAFYGQFRTTTGDSPAVRYRAAVTWQNLAELSRDLREVDLAQEAFGRALAQAERLTAEFPGEVRFQTLYIDLLISMANFSFYQLKDFQAAQGELERAGRRIDERLRSDPDHVDDWLRRKQTWLEGMSHHAQEAHDVDAQIQYALAARELAIQRQNGTQEGLVYVTRRVAEALEDSDPSRAAQYYLKAIEASRSWAEVDAERARVDGRIILLHYAFDFFQKRDPELAAELIAEAVELSQRLISNFPNLGVYQKRLRASLSRLRALIESGNLAPESQRRMLKELVETTPNVSEMHRLLAEALRQAPEPLTALGQAIDEFPKRGEYHFARGMLLLEEGSNTDAMADFAAALKAAGNSNRLVNQIADASRTLNFQGQHKLALELAELAQQYAVTTPMLDMALAECKLRLGRPAEALAHVEDSIRKEPERVFWRFKRRAEAHYALGCYDEAVADLRAAYQADPDDESIVRWLWPQSVVECPEESYRQGRFDLIEQAVQEHPNEADYIISHAGMQILQGNLDEARKDYDRAMELADPEDVDWLRQNYLDCLMVAEQFSEAIVVLSQAIAADAESWINFLNRGRVYIALQDYRNALADFEQVLQLEERNSNNVAWLVARQPVDSDRLKTAALKWAERAVELDPDAPATRNTLGACQYRNAEWQAAIHSLEQAHQPGDNGSFDTFFLAMAHQQLGHEQEARKWLDEAVQWMHANRPNDEELRQLREEAESLLNINDN